VLQCRSMPTWITIRTFIAIFFALFGLRLMASTDEMRASLGALFAALGITFLWRRGLRCERVSRAGTTSLGDTIRCVCATAALTNSSSRAPLALEYCSRKMAATSAWARSLMVASHQKLQRVYWRLNAN
jgi:hypothetical protein